MKSISKKLKNIALGTVLMSGVTACGNFDETLNVNPKAPASVPAEALFSNAHRRLMDHLQTPSVNVNVSRLLAQYWSERQYTSESRYDLETRNILDTHWQVLYRDVLMDFKEARKTVSTIVDAKERNNKEGIITLLEVYTYQLLVDSYGNVPYTEALLGSNNIYPKYDDAKTVYADLMSKLDAAIAKMDASGKCFDASADKSYSGNAAKWIKFANSMKLRLAIRIVEDDFAKASKAIIEAAPKAFASNADNAIYDYATGVVNGNTLYVQLHRDNTTRIDFMASNTMMDILKGVNDPRIPFFFAPIQGSTTVFEGYPYGQIKGTSKVLSTPSAKMKESDFDGAFMDYAEVEFILAEAAARGIAVSGTAAEHYDKAITASITSWGGTTAQSAAYLAQPNVAYATATGTYKQKIGTQKWIALYNRSFEGWIEWRRLDFPKLNAPEAMTYEDIPVRLKYPIKEATLNGDNLTPAKAAMGGDTYKIRLFWDKQ